MTNSDCVSVREKKARLRHRVPFDQGLSKHTENACVMVKSLRSLLRTSTTTVVHPRAAGCPPRVCYGRCPLGLPSHHSFLSQVPSNVQRYRSKFCNKTRIDSYGLILSSFFPFFFKRSDPKNANYVLCPKSWNMTVLRKQFWVIVRVALRKKTAAASQ